jgi:4a-hydroxytetrahydrobiopterin dehydratase
VLHSFGAQLRSGRRQFKVANVPNVRSDAAFFALAEPDPCKLWSRTARAYLTSAAVGQENLQVDAPDGWTLEEGGKALTRTVQFKDFSEAFAFLARVALHAEKVDHHPEFTSVWNRVDFRLTSHDAGGITERDRALAEAINRLVC